MQKLLYEGKAKRVYATEEKSRYLVEFKDDATAFNGAKRGTILRKGEVNCQVSAVLFQYLAARGIRTHFVALTGTNTMLAEALQIFKVEVVIRNIVAGSMAKRLGLKEGMVLPEPLLEWYLKDDDLGDPLLCESHLRMLGILPAARIAEIGGAALKVNSLLQDYMKERGMQLVDFKLEFGTATDGGLVLGDEISPDTCRFWDLATSEKLDKDRFRRDLGNVEGAYAEVYRRVTGRALED